MTRAAASEIAIPAFAALVLFLISACGVSAGKSSEEEATATHLDATKQTQSPIQTKTLPTPQNNPTTATKLTKSPVFEPQADFSTVEELISTAQTKLSDSDLICLGSQNTQRAREIEVLGRCVNLLYMVPRDGIPAIFDPKFTTPEFLDIPNEELVIGLSIEGDHRAYSVPYLSNYEVVNDVVGGKPVAVTW